MSCDSCDRDLNMEINASCSSMAISAHVCAKMSPSFTRSSSHKTWSDTERWRKMRTWNKKSLLMISIHFPSPRDSLSALPLCLDSLALLENWPQTTTCAPATRSWRWKTSSKSCALKKKYVCSDGSILRFSEKIETWIDDDKKY